MFTLLLLNAIIYFWFKVHIMNATDEGLTNFASILSIGSALCLAAFAQLNVKLFESMTEQECFVTQTEYECNLFTKLSLAYLLSSVVLPLSVPFLPFIPLIGMLFPHPVLRFDEHSHSLVPTVFPLDFSWMINQSWFEVGGVAMVLFFSIPISSLIQSFMRIAQPKTIISRIKAQSAVSQMYLNSLLAPPRIQLGTVYAQAYKLFSLGVIVAQLTPLAYLVTSLLFLVEFCVTKYALCRVWARAATVESDLSSRLQRSLKFSLLFAVLVRCAILASARVGAYGFLPAVLSLGYLLGSGNYQLFKFVFDRASRDHESVVSYDRFFKHFLDEADSTTYENERQKGISRYMCPKVNHLYQFSGKEGKLGHLHGAVQMSMLEHSFSKVLKVKAKAKTPLPPVRARNSDSLFPDAQAGGEVSETTPERGAPSSAKPSSKHIERSREASTQQSGVLHGVYESVKL